MRRESFIVPADAAGCRASELIRRLLPHLKESALRALFSSRDVRLDGARIDASARVSPGQTLLLFLPDQLPAEALDVVYEDGDVLLVNKRPGLSVQTGDLPPAGEEGPALTLEALCLRHVREAGAEPAFPPRPCHRLDIKTSGLCLFAKNAEALAILEEVFRERTVEKRYECLVRGQPKPPAARCRAWLLKDAARARVQILDHPAPGARPIATEYETLEAGPVSRLRVRLLTGRTHQIRAHLSALGHPLLGDDVYGDRDWNRRMKARGLKLCAVSLRLDTGGGLPQLDGRTFSILPPF